MRRDEFLERVRRATTTAGVPRPPTPRPAPHVPDADPIGAFEASLTTVDGVVHRPAVCSEIPRLVVELLRSHQVSKVLAWDASALPVPGIREAVAAGGMELVDGEVPGAAPDRTAHQVGYAAVDAGITGATAGFTTSGSMVLTAGPGRPRMASLIPTLHIALLPVAALHRSVSEWAEHNVALATSTSNLVFITGPSRTGDIEMQLNLGVHGPRAVHVVLVPEC